MVKIKTVEISWQLWNSPSRATAGIMQLFSQSEYYSLWRVNWCVKLVDRTLVYKIVTLWSTFYSWQASWWLKLFKADVSAEKEQAFRKLLIQLMPVWMHCDLSSALAVLGPVPALPGLFAAREAWSLRCSSRHQSPSTAISHHSHSELHMTFPSALED